MRLVIVGAGDAGIAAGLRAREVGPSVEVTIFARHCASAGAIRAGAITWRPVSPVRWPVLMSRGYTDTTAVAESTVIATPGRRCGRPA